MKPVGFVVFACCSIPKYRQQLEDCYATWIQDALEANCLVRVYAGECPEDMNPELRALCQNVEFGDSYFSATYKQWCGLEDMAKNQEPTHFTFICGTDTYVNIKNLLDFLKEYNDSTPALFGNGDGKGCVDKKVYSYYSGGGGLILNRAGLLKIAPDIYRFVDWWLQTTGDYVTYIDSSGNEILQNLLTACDCALCIVCQQHGIEQVTIPDSKMTGGGNHTSACLDFPNMISCHFMLHEDFYECHALIHSLKN